MNLTPGKFFVCTELKHIAVRNVSKGERFSRELYFKWFLHHVTMHQGKKRMSILRSYMTFHCVRLKKKKKMLSSLVPIKHIGMTPSKMYTEWATNDNPWYTP